MSRVSEIRNTPSKFLWKIQNFWIIIKVLQRVFKGFRRLWVGNLIKAFRFFRFFGLIEFEIFRFKNKRDSCKFNLFFNSMIVVLWPVKIRNFIEDLIFHLKIVNWRWMKNNFHHSVCCVGGHRWYGTLMGQSNDYRPRITVTRIILKANLTLFNVDTRNT